MVPPFLPYVQPDSCRSMISIKSLGSTVSWDGAVAVNAEATSTNFCGGASATAGDAAGAAGASFSFGHAQEGTHPAASRSDPDAFRQKDQPVSCCSKTSNMSPARTASIVVFVGSNAWDATPLINTCVEDTGVGACAVVAAAIGAAAGTTFEPLAPGALGLVVGADFGTDGCFGGGGDTTTGAFGNADSCLCAGGNGCCGALDGG